MTEIREAVHSLVTEAFAPVPVEIGAITDIGSGRGIFSQVLRAELRWLDPGDGPGSVVVKLPASGPNGEAARRSGAYRREALAYRQLLPSTPVRTPTAHLVTTGGDSSVSLVLEDLSDRRAVDQLNGLPADDCIAVALALRRLHDHWTSVDGLDELPLRRAVPATIPAAALRAGLSAIDSRWSSLLNGQQRAALASLVANQERLAADFAACGPPTLCHGDPRADNLVFEPSGEPVLFDWQQLAAQLGEADLAWLAATSVEPHLRRDLDAELQQIYGTSSARYRLGFVLPGLAVLLLAQRDLEGPRAHRLVASSLTRIASALVDLDCTA